MKFPFLKTEIQQFINANIGADISKIALHKNPFPEIEWISLLNQIAAKTKAKDKLPTWYRTENIIYPFKIAIEQTSSEITALYKAELLSGIRLIDLTGGFGVDDFYFSKRFESVVHCERNAELSEIAAQNFLTLNATNIECFGGDSSDLINNLKRKFDWMYIDPSRRSESKGKVFMLKDCEPNVPKLLSTYFNFTNNILIKTAPILDLSSGVSELNHVKNIHIVAVNNEVKELLWELSKNYLGRIGIKTVNIVNDKREKFDFVFTASHSVTFSLPKKYLYEPNSAIMKSGGFDAVAEQYQISKLHQHSHLYTSDSIIDFPGRIFEIENNIPYHKSEMKQFLQNVKANITTRNFPETVENIRKKWKIKEGGNSYCFFTTDENDNKIALICSKIN